MAYHLGDLYVSGIHGVVQCGAHPGRERTGDCVWFVLSQGEGCFAVEALCFVYMVESKSTIPQAGRLI